MRRYSSSDMRRAVIVCLGLIAWAMQPAVSQSTSPAAQLADTSAAQSDAAEKHVKRTACLKDAKSKRLVGAQRTAYVKDCIAANPPPTSQSSATSASPNGRVPVPE
jgi:hypothetical protein